MKKKVILLDDDPDIREIIEYILEGHGIEVQSYGRAQKILEIDHSGANLFLLDIMLPDGSGLEIYCQLRKDDKTSDIPIVMMSAHTDSIKSSDCEPIDFIKKPFDVDNFVLRIKTHIA